MSSKPLLPSFELANYYNIMKLNVSHTQPWNTFFISDISLVFLFIIAQGGQVPLD